MHFRQMESAEHKSYTVSFKLKVIESAEKIGNRAAARLHAVNERCIRRWRTEKDSLKRMRHSSGDVMPNFEEQVALWINEQEAKLLPVTQRLIRNKAKLLAKSMEITNFKGTPQWYNRFMKRKKKISIARSSVKGSTNSKPCKKKTRHTAYHLSTKFKSYTAGFKLAVVDKAEKKGNRAASREFGIDESCIRRWRLDKDDLAQMPVFKRANRRGSVAFPELEERLAVWVQEQQKQAIPISVDKICNEAKLAAQQMEIIGFKGDPNWCYRFLKRKNMSIKSLKQYVWLDCSKRESLALNNINRLIHQLKLTSAQIINMTIVSFAFDCLLEGSITDSNEMDVTWSDTGSERTFFSCFLACAANGVKLKPFIVFKNRIFEDYHSSDVIIQSNEKGWKSDSVLQKWMNQVWRKRKGAIFNPRGMLIVESKILQLLELVKTDCEKVSAMVIAVPQKLSPLNFLTDNYFKSEMQNHYEKWRNEKCSSGITDDKGKMNLDEIIRWVTESWKTVSVSSIISAFKEAKINVLVKEEISDYINDSEKSKCNSNFNKITLDDTIFLKQLFETCSDDSDFGGFS